MFTAPPPPDVSKLSDLDDLQEETINPKQENLAPVKQPRFSMIVDAEIGEGTVVGDHVNRYNDLSRPLSSLKMRTQWQLQGV
jgi:hypothetical protein